MATLERAIEIAARAHAGQVDKGGHPYILHPLRLMQRLEAKSERIAAVLHDVVEDTPWTLEQLRAEGFSEDVLQALDALAKRPGESRMEAASRAVIHPIARAVKLADVADNMDLSRLPNPTPADYARVEVYKNVQVLLLAGPPEG